MPCTRLVLTHPIIKTWVTGCTARPEMTEGTPGVVLGVGVGGLEATIKIRGTNVTTIMAMIIVGVTHAEGVPAGVEGSGVAWLPVAFLDTCLEIEGKYLRDLCMEFFERLKFFCVFIQNILSFCSGYGGYGYRQRPGWGWGGKWTF